MAHIENGVWVEDDPGDAALPDPPTGMMQVLVDPTGKEHFVYSGSGTTGKGWTEVGLDIGNYHLSTLLSGGWRIGNPASPTKDQFTSTLPAPAPGQPAGSISSPWSPESGPDDPGWVGGSAAEKTAQLLRNQFADWQKLFKPIELGQMQQLSFNTPGVLDDAVYKAGGAAMQQSDTTGGIFERTNRALGVIPTEGQGQTSKRLMDLNKAQNVAGAENAARENVRLQDQIILLGSAPNPNVAKGIM